MCIEMVVLFTPMVAMIVLVAVRYEMEKRTRGAILTGKNVGPAYWGVYAGSDTVNQQALTSFTCSHPGAGLIATARNAK